MDRWLGWWREYCYAVLRIVVGLLFCTHGAQKLFGFPGSRGVAGTFLQQTAGSIELGTGLLIALGFCTTYAAFLASGEMAFAYFLSHAPHGFWPILNRGELAVLYCFVFLFIASRGAGPWSIDRRLRRAKPWTKTTGGAWR